MTNGQWVNIYKENCGILMVIIYVMFKKTVFLILRFQLLVDILIFHDKI